LNLGCLKAKGMTAGRLQELDEMATRLRALARKLPPGQQRHEITLQIRRFRKEIYRGPKLKKK
jgi:hypothetical protein